MGEVMFLSWIWGLDAESCYMAEVTQRETPKNDMQNARLWL